MGMAADELSEARERERQQYRQEIDSLTKAVDSVRSGSLSKLKDERERAASELEAERSMASAKVERYRQRAEQEGAAAQEELELARQGCRRDQEALHAAHAAVNHTGLEPRLVD